VHIAMIGGHTARFSGYDAVAQAHYRAKRPEVA